ncbi:hypothetical protein [Pseudonocardia sp. GCM10023141]
MLVGLALAEGFSVGLISRDQEHLDALAHVSCRARNRAIVA